MNMEEFLRVGIIATTHGLKGEVKVHNTSDDPNRFESLEQVYIDTGKEKIPATVETVRYFKNTVILKFKEFNSIEGVEAFRGKDILVDREHALPLGENEYYICDLVGLSVFTDEGEEFGTLTDVMRTGANDVYIIRGKDDKEYLFPVIPDCIRKVDLENRTLTVHILDGLLSL